MRFENILITNLLNQLLDLPGIIEGAKDGKGRGRQVIAVARTCSLIFIVLDVLKPLGHKRLIEHELEGFGLRLNKQPPNITFRKKDKGGINLQTMVRATVCSSRLFVFTNDDYLVLLEIKTSSINMFLYIYTYTPYFTVHSV